MQVYIKPCRVYSSVNEATTMDVAEFSENIYDTKLCFPLGSRSIQSSIDSEKTKK